MKEFLLSKQLSAKTISIYMYWINKFLNYGTRNLPDRIFEYKEYCMKNYSIETQKVILSSLKFLVEYKELNISISLPKSNWILKGTFITEDEYNTLLDDAIYNDSFISTRNKEIIKFLWKTGLRVGELINLKWKDVDSIYIFVTSKNNKSRKIPYQQNMFDVISQYKSGQHVFTSKNGKQLSYTTIYNIFKNSKLKNISPHTMRHSFATRLIKKGVPLNFVSELLGHSNINTTLAYLHFDNEHLINILKEKDWS